MIRHIRVGNATLWPIELRPRVYCWLVGARRFKLRTFRSQSGRAIRLRYAPIRGASERTRTLKSVSWKSPVPRRRSAAMQRKEGAAAAYRSYAPGP